MTTRQAHGKEGEGWASKSGWQHAGEALIAVAIAFVMLWLIPKLVPGSDVMTHLTARIQAGMVGGFYPARHHDDVTVLLIDDTALSKLDQGWPVPYATHARWLKNLGSSYTPRAIFLDVTFVQARKDETLPALVSALCGLRDRGIPVFLAALPDPHTGQLAVRPDLKSPDEEKPCFSLVGVTFDAHKIDRLVWTYPLWMSAEEGAAKPAAAQVLSRSAALAMAQDVAHIQVTQEHEPMALTWGVNNLNQERFAGWCRQARGGFSEMAPPPLRALWSGDELLKPICPYARALTMTDLRSSSKEEDSRLHDLLDGRYVMIGANLSGSNDMVTSPVHGEIPGVFMHAMALDNLLTYEESYKRALEWGLPPAWPLFWLGLIVVLVAHGLRVYAPAVVAALRVRLSENTLRTWDAIAGFIKGPGEGSGSKAQGSADAEPAALRPWWRDLSANVLALLLFLARKIVFIVLTTTVIMTLVVIAQKLFDVGTLPIVHLVAMVLLAELLGWTGLVSKLIFRRAGP